MKVDDINSYYFDTLAERYQTGQDPAGFGKGYVWKFGIEKFCNMEGRYMHIVGDLSHLAGQTYTQSIC